MQQPTTISESSGLRRYAPSVCVFLALLCGLLVVYGRAIDHEFVAFDDDRYVYAHPMVTDGLTWEGAYRAWTLKPSANRRWDPHGNWHPLTWLSLMADAQRYGAERDQAGGYILTNVVIHALNAFLLYLVMRRLSGTFWPAVMVAALFAFHPLRVEAVAWACQRKEVLSSFFGLATILVYTRYARRPAWGRYLVVAFMLALSMASKQTLVALPVALLLLDYWPLGRTGLLAATDDGLPETPGQCPKVSWQRLLVEKIPLLFFCALAAAAAFLGVYWEGGTHDAGELSVAVRVLNAAVSYVAVLGKTIWPVDMAFFYPHPGFVYDDAFERLLWPGLAAIGFLLAVTGLVLWQARKRPYLIVGWFWYIIMYLPMSGLSQAGYHAMADRFTYIPLIGIYGMVVWGAREVVCRWQGCRYLVAAVLTFAVVAFAAVSYVQVGTWRNSATAFEHAVQVTSRNYIAHYNLGVEYADRAFRSGGREKALPLFEKAEGHFRQACEIYPDLPRHHFNLGKVYSELDRSDEAIEKFETTIKIEPEHGGALGALGVVLVEQGEYAKATPFLQKALRFNGADREVVVALAESMQMQGEFGDAIGLYRLALQLRPEWPRVSVRLAWLLAAAPEPRMRDGREAVRLAEQVVARTERQHAESLDTLAAAFADTGRFDEAITTAREAISLLADDAADQADAIRLRLKLYEAGRPYRLSE